MITYIAKAKRRLTQLIRKDSTQTSALQPNWPLLLHRDWANWQVALKQSQNGPDILIATSSGGYSPSTVLESTLAVALTLRGAHIHILLCDEFLPACTEAMLEYLPDGSQENFARYGPTQHLCTKCFSSGKALFHSLGLEVHNYSRFATKAERQQAHVLAQKLPYQEIKDYQLYGIAVGEHAWAGALRFYARGQLKDEPQAESILRRYLEASQLTTIAARRLLQTYRFAGLCVTHGIYVPHGLIAAVARRVGIPLSAWAAAYRKQCFIFSHDDTYHHTMLNEPTELWENLPWTPAMETQILNYLKSRWQGTQDWIWFHEKPEENLSQISQELGIDLSKPFIGLLTNVMWDAQLHYPANAFPNMLEWVCQTIQYFASRPDLQLVIRIHPAEVRGTLKSRQPLLAEIRREFPILPKNIFVISPESQISTYAIMALCNAAIIYGTKTGVELASMGIPVIVAGEAWIRNKGITLDARSENEYFQLLDRLPFSDRMSEAAIQRARKYAYHFFFRRMIPLEMMEPTGNWPPFQVKLTSLDDLQVGRSPGLDVICDGILNGKKFIYPAESFTSVLRD